MNLQISTILFLLVRGTGHFFETLSVGSLGLIIPRLTPPARLCIRQHMPFFQISHVYQGVDMCKSKKRACAVVYTYVVLVNGKLPKTLLWIMFFILFIQPKSHHLYSCADVGLLKPAKKDRYGTGI